MKHGSTWSHDRLGCRCGPCKDAKSAASRKANASRELNAHLPAPPFGERPPWEQDALCAQSYADAWFPEKGGSTQEAKAVCMRCPVRPDCLEYALENGEQFGIWGGLSERERRKLKKRAA